MAVYSVWPAAAKLYCDHICSHPPVTPANHSRREGRQSRPFEEAFWFCSGRVKELTNMCMTKGSSPEAKLDYQIDGIQQSPVKKAVEPTTQPRQK